MPSIVVNMQDDNDLRGGIQSLETTVWIYVSRQKTRLKMFVEKTNEIMWEGGHICIVINCSSEDSLFFNNEMPYGFTTLKQG